VDEEESEDLLRAIQQELPRRNYGEAVRLEVADTCENRKVRFLLHHFGLSERNLYRVNGPVNLSRLAALYDLVDRPDLKYRPFAPAIPARLQPPDEIFRIIGEGDLLLHHPYQSFSPILELLQQAADDPGVLAIKMTLYRTIAKSALTESLARAARNGKAVTVVVELRARFDEADNIDIAQKLKASGANVVYGIMGYKAHAKMLMVVRREGDKLRRYVHLGTGNYHPGTAKAYTDISLLTCKPEFGEDVHEVFNQLTGIGQPQPLKRLLQSPFTLQREVIRRIDLEADAARAGRPCGIAAKVNALIDPAVVAALYRASAAGVPIRLKVRGMCSLRPGVPGVSDTIQVHSFVGRFLEHARVYWFHADGDEIMYCASADWMERNLYRRVEVAFPIEEPALKQRLREEIFEAYDRDDRQTWVLLPDGTYRRRAPLGPEPLAAQEHLLERLTGNARRT
jgi:polyphosphate kinase